MTDILRIETNERVDLEDFEFLANSVARAEEERTANFDTSPDRQRAWILDGFAITSPGPGYVLVTRGRAILSYRENGIVQYGALSVGGDATKQVDISGYAPGTYGIYIRFELVDSDPRSRIFWNPTDTGSEFAQTINTRRAANWSLRLERTNPGAEWLKIGEVDQATTTITDMRPLYFEGEVNNSYRSGWSSDGGGVADDRNANRATYGVTDHQMFTAAMRQCLKDIKGRGLREWYSRDIGGLNVGFDANPVEDRLAVGDATFYLLGGTTVPKLFWDTDDSLEFNRGSNYWEFKLGGAAEYFLDTSVLKPSNNEANDLGASAARWADYYGRRNYLKTTGAGAELATLELWTDITGHSGDATRWSNFVASDGTWTLKALKDAGDDMGDALRAHRNPSTFVVSAVDIPVARIGLGGDYGLGTDAVEFFKNLEPSVGTIDIGLTGNRFRTAYLAKLDTTEVGSSLISDTNFGDDLGSTSKNWQHLYAGRATLRNNGATYPQVRFGDERVTDPDGIWWNIKCYQNSTNATALMIGTEGAGGAEHDMLGFFRTDGEDTPIEITAYANLGCGVTGLALGSSGTRWNHLHCNGFTVYALDDRSEGPIFKGNEPYALLEKSNASSGQKRWGMGSKSDGVFEIDALDDSDWDTGVAWLTATRSSGTTALDSLQFSLGASKTVIFGNGVGSPDLVPCITGQGYLGTSSYIWAGARVGGLIIESNGPSLLIRDANAYDEDWEDWRIATEAVGGNDGRALVFRSTTHGNSEPTYGWLSAVRSLTGGSEYKVDEIDLMAETLIKLYCSGGNVEVYSQLDVHGDTGARSNYVSFTHIYNESLSTGVGTIKLAGTTARDSTGWLKIYVDGNTRYIPYWTTITG